MASFSRSETRRGGGGYKIFSIGTNKSQKRQDKPFVGMFCLSGMDQPGQVWSLGLIPYASTQALAHDERNLN